MIYMQGAIHTLNFLANHTLHTLIWDNCCWFDGECTANPTSSTRVSPPVTLWWRTDLFISRPSSSKVGRYLLKFLIWKYLELVDEYFFDTVWGIFGEAQWDSNSKCKGKAYCRLERPMFLQSPLSWKGTKVKYSGVAEVVFQYQADHKENLDHLIHMIIIPIMRVYHHFWWH